jgi:hypothetical protein
MSKTEESTSYGLWRVLVAMSVLCTGIGAFFWLRMGVWRGLDRADAFELTQHLNRWIEAKRPEGEKLVEFMKGRRQDLVVTNRAFVIGGTNLVTQFAVTKLKSGRPGAFFVTTNEVLIRVDSSDRAELFSLMPSK